MVSVTIDWYQYILNKYGADHPRKTEIKNFDTIEASKVVEANLKLYINREEGFIGTAMKKDEFVCNCSDIDDIIIFYKDGKFKVVKVADKIFVGKNILYVSVFKKNDKRTIYNVVYRDGKKGAFMIKRFNITGLSRDKEYDLTQGKEGSKVVYFTANPNGEAEVIKVTLEPNSKLRKLIFDKDFSTILIKGRSSKGNLLTRNPIHRISLKSHGHSTFGGRKVWFDNDVKRINYDEHGQYLGEFHDDDKILVILNNGDFYYTNFDVNNHYEDNVMIVEKFDPAKVWSVALFDFDQGYPYLKRFQMEPMSKKQNFLGENPQNTMYLITGQVYPRILVHYGGGDSDRAPMEIDVEQFIGVKSFKARGKRLTTLSISKIEELEPTRFPEPETEEENETEDIEEVDDSDNNEDVTDLNTSSDEYTPPTIDEVTGEYNLFPDE